MKSFKFIMSIVFVMFVMTINSYASSLGVGKPNVSGGVVSQMLYPAFVDSGKIGDIYVFTSNQFYTGYVWTATETPYESGSTLSSMTIVYNITGLALGTEVYIGYGEGLVDTYATMISKNTSVLAYPDYNTTYYLDADGDGYGDPNNSILGMANLVPAGYVTNNTDCNDNYASIHPGAKEIAGDGIDQDCNGSDLVKNIPILDLATYYLDADGDGYGDHNTTTLGVSTSVPTGYVVDDTDCDDTDASINPGATEIEYDGIDQNCDGKDVLDGTPPKFLTFYLDADGDGYGDPNKSKTSITSTMPFLGYVVNNTDCDDSDPSIHPGATEIENDGIDQNCDGYDIIIVQSITVADDLSIYLSNIEYNAGPLFGGILYMNFTLVYDSTSGTQLWKVDMDNISYNVAGALQDVVTLNNDLSFTLTDAKYDAGLLGGMYTLDVTFEYVKIVGDVIYWKISDLVVK